MKKLTLLGLILFLFAGYSSAQQAETAPSFTQTELLAFKDITPVLSALNKSKDYSPYIVLGFNLVINYTEGAMSTSIVEPADGESLTEKQRQLISQYAGKGASFTLEGITLKEPGKPGTPYDPKKESVFSVANVPFSVTK